MSRRHPGRFGRVVGEIIQDIVCELLVIVEAITLLCVAVDHVPNEHFYDTVLVTLYCATLIMMAAVPFIVHRTRKRRRCVRPAPNRVRRSTHHGIIRTVLIGGAMACQLVSRSTQDMARSTHRRW